jgi:hypothetical protein
MSANDVFTLIVMENSENSSEFIVNRIKEHPGALATVRRESTSADVHKMTQSMGIAAELMKIAYAASQGHPHSTIVLEILYAYSSLAKDTHTSIDSFARGSIEALENIRNALEFANQGNYEDALEIFGRNAVVAAEFSAEAGLLASRFADLRELGQTAASAADGARTRNVADKSAMDARIAEEEAKRAELESQMIQLQTDIERLKTEEATAISGWSEERRRQHSLQMTKAIVEGTGYVLVFPVVVRFLISAFQYVTGLGGQETENLSDTEKTLFEALIMKTREQRHLIDCKESVRNDLLSASLKAISIAHAERNMMERAARSLDAAVIVLAQVHDVLDNMRCYWSVVAVSER